MIYLQKGNRKVQLYTRHVYEDFSWRLWLRRSWFSGSQRSHTASRLLSIFSAAAGKWDMQAQNPGSHLRYARNGRKLPIGLAPAGLLYVKIKLECRKWKHTKNNPKKYHGLRTQKNSMTNFYKQQCIQITSFFAGGSVKSYLLLLVVVMRSYLLRNTDTANIPKLDTPRITTACSLPLHNPQPSWQKTNSWLVVLKLHDIG